MTDVHVESVVLDDGVSFMYRDFGQRIRMAYDPRQITEAGAMAALYVAVPHLAAQSPRGRLLHQPVARAEALVRSAGPLGAGR